MKMFESILIGIAGSMLASAISDLFILHFKLKSDILHVFLYLIYPDKIKKKAEKELNEKLKSNFIIAILIVGIIVLFNNNINLNISNSIKMTPNIYFDKENFGPIQAAVKEGNDEKQIVEETKIQIQ